MTEQQTAADTLDQAAADAVAAQETPAAEQTAEQVQITEAELPNPETEHKERSDFGRKINAVLRRQDESDEKFERIMQLLEQQAMSPYASRETNQWDTTVDDQPLTVQQLETILDRRERKKTEQADKYQKDYHGTIKRMARNVDEDDDPDAILGELTKLTYTPSGDGVADAEGVFRRAYKNYIKGTSIEKMNPLKGGSAPGVVTTQKTVAREAALPKLDGPAQAYLNFVAQEDGTEKAQKLHKSIGKE
jgi:hypothetical protein